MSEKTPRVPVATMVSHDGCPRCERLAGAVVATALKHRNGKPFVVQDRDESHYATAIVPARIEWWEEFEGRWVRSLPTFATEPATTLGAVARDIEARADRLQEAAWDALANEDYDEMRHLEARAQGLRQAARIVRGERRKREQ